MLYFQPIYQGEPTITLGNRQDVCVISSAKYTSSKKATLSGAEIELRKTMPLEGKPVFKFRQYGRDVCLSIEAMREVVEQYDSEQAIKVEAANVDAE